MKKMKKAKSKISAKRARVRNQAAVQTTDNPLGNIAVPAIQKARTPRQYATELYKLNREFFEDIYQRKTSILFKSELKRFQKQYPNVREYVVKRVLANLKDIEQWTNVGKKVTKEQLEDFQQALESTIINIFPQPEVSSALWIYSKIKQDEAAEQELKLLSLDDNIVANRFKYISNHVWNYDGAQGTKVEIVIPRKSSPIQFDMRKLL